MMEFIDESRGEEEDDDFGDGVGGVGAGETEWMDYDMLISLVKSYPALYARSKKQYCGKNFNKDLAWNAIGELWKPPITGKVANAEWYKLRQKFGKELRKARATQPVGGRSGQPAVKPCVSPWPFFEALSFLSDHIACRRTVSNYKRREASSSDRPVAAWSLDLFAGSSGSDGNAGDSSQSDPAPAGEVSLFRTPSPMTSPTGVSVKPPARNSPSPSLSSASEGSCSSASTDILKAMTKAPKRVTPEPDSFAQKRRKKEEDFMSSMKASNESIVNVAKDLVAAIATPAPAVAQEAPQEVDPVLGAIKFALAAVPSDRKLACMLDVVSLIKDKYCNQE